MLPNTTNNIKTADSSVNQSGSVLLAYRVANISAQAVVTGTSTGTLNIQASNDIISTGGTPAPTNWSIIPTIGTVAIAGAGVYLIPCFPICYNYVRTSFVASNAASGTINVNVQTWGF
jgi:hypothetical protein